MSRLTAIMSGKGGVGKTTLTAALGITLARMGKKVLLLDGDLGLCNLDLILGVSDRVRFNMYDMALGKCFSDEVIVPVETNLDFMAGYLRELLIRFLKIWMVSMITSSWTVRPG